MQKPNELQKLNEAITGNKLEVIAQELKTIKAEQINAVQPLENNPVYLAVVKGNVDALLLFIEHGVNLNLVETNGDTLLDVIMKRARGFDVCGQMALLLASLGAKFAKEEETALERADYTHRKVFEDFFYHNIPTWQ